MLPIMQFLLFQVILHLKELKNLQTNGSLLLKKEIFRNEIFPSEPVQTKGRSLILEKDVPSDALYKVWHIGPRKSPDFYTLDLITDILAGGETGRLHTKLVREKKLFSEINAYITSDIDPGLIIVQGKLMKDIDIYHAEEGCK